MNIRKCGIIKNINEVNMRVTNSKFYANSVKNSGGSLYVFSKLFISYIYK